MKIGIVTFYSECNYGAFLQAFGSYSYLKSIGHDVYFINYNPSKDVSFFLKLGLHDGTFFHKIKRRYNINIRYKLKPYCGKYLKGFEEARKRFFAESEKVNEDNIGRITAEFDCIYVGSDQVWNMRKAGKEKLYYFLDFFKSGKTRKVSYAACFGQYYQTPSMIPAMRVALKDFNAISVRNEVSRRLVKELAGTDAPIVCDPTVLLGDFKFAESDYTTKLGLKDYILVYCLDPRQKKKHEDSLAFLRSKLGKKVVTITSSHHTAWSLGNADVNIYDATPMDWLNLFANAEYVYTDSFHGAIFSLLYKKELIMMIEDNERADRLKDLSERYEVTNRLCFTLEDVKSKYDNRMEYDAVSRRISDHRAMSIDFLTKALS